MFDAVASLLPLVFVALGIAGSSDPTALTVVAIAAAAAAAAAVIAIAHAVARQSAPRAAVHPRASIDVSVLVAQSAPDAAGHPLPRAPGLAASAA